MGCLEKDNGWKCLKREAGFLLPAFLGVFKNYDQTTLGDFNDANYGIYTVAYRNASNRPSDDVGILLCFKSTYIAQIFVPIVTENGIYVRSRDVESDSWRAWRKIETLSIPTT